LGPAGPRERPAATPVAAGPRQRQAAGAGGGTAGRGRGNKGSSWDELSGGATLL